MIKIVIKYPDLKLLAKEWFGFIKEKFNKRLVRFKTIRINGKVFIDGGNDGLQCPHCLYMQHSVRTIQNSLKHPDGHLYGYYFREEDETHAEYCPQK